MDLPLDLMPNFLPMCCTKSSIVMATACIMKKANWCFVSAMYGVFSEPMWWISADRKNEIYSCR